MVLLSTLAKSMCLLYSFYVIPYPVEHLKVFLQIKKISSLSRISDSYTDISFANQIESRIIFLISIKANVSLIHDVKLAQFPKRNSEKHVL